MRPVAPLMIDLDDFKKINDTHGHSAGDATIKSRRRPLSAAPVRHFDILHSLWWRGVRRGDAATAAARPRQAWPNGFAGALRRGASPEPHLAGQFRSRRASVLPLSDRSMTMDDLIGRADRALHDAKQAGKNQVRTDRASALAT